MHVAPSPTDGRAAAVAAALAPYAWREFTDRMLARRVVGAVDRHHVICFLAGLPGTDLGILDAVEPAEAGDEGVDALVCALDGQRWREWSLARLCADVMSSLEAWQAERESLESDLRRLLGGH
jgi:hypothetical protein